MSNIKFNPSSRDNYLYNIAELYSIDPDIDDWMDVEFLEKLESRPECIPISAVRNGKYEIVEGKGFRRRYYHYNGVWAKEKKLYKCFPGIDLYEWGLLPNLREVDWNIMKSIPINRLTHRWRDIVYAHNNMINLKTLLREQKIWMNKNL